MTHDDDHDVEDDDEENDNDLRQRFARIRTAYRASQALRRRALARSLNGILAYRRMPFS